MSLSYRPVSKIKPHCPSQYDDGSWDVNVAGAEMLGGLHLQLELPTSRSPDVCPDYPPRVPYEMDKATAEATAKKLSETSDEDVKATFERFKDCWVDRPGAIDEYLEWARNWQKFLEVCGGYEAD